MGLYINNSKDNKIYKNSQTIHEPNQAYARHDFLTELIDQQVKANETLKQSLDALQARTAEQEKSQHTRWNRLDSHLSDLRKNDQNQKDVDQQIIQSLQSIHEKNQHFQTKLNSEAQLNKDLLDKVNQLTQTIGDMSKKIASYEEASQQISLQMYEQLEMQKEVSEKIAEQEEFQGEVLTRLDTQEALVDKITHQLNHIRSIIFERTNFLAAKIEDGYKVTSSYVYKLMTGSDKPLTFFLLNQKNEENHSQSSQDN
ncbi:hypothetical protein [Neobacillus muris]|uniref:hypothetical protein n=1 Tax=Neobacillus muris TaxID=2941334 RepID=UPI00203F33FC|nr:hypothetical protein [Neobacillus muris]